MYLQLEKPKPHNVYVLQLVTGGDNIIYSLR